MPKISISPIAAVLAVFLFLAEKPAAVSQPLFYTDFSTLPAEDEWTGNISRFRIDESTSPFTLRLDAPSDQGSAYLSTRQTFRPVYWEWSLKQAFAPSNNNRAFFFLNADRPELDHDINGLAIRTGENGTPKHFRLMQIVDGNQDTQLLKSDTQIESDTGYRIRVLITPDNMIHLYVGSGPEDTPLLQTETMPVEELKTPLDGHFGFRTHFTATRSDQFFFGDVLLSGSLPLPAVSEVSVAGEPALPDHEESAGLENRTTDIKITFNVPPDSSELTPGLFRLEDGTHPDQVNCHHPQVCTLSFNGELAPGRRVFEVESYHTIYNQQSEPEEHPFFIAEHPVPGDVVINEFLYDPFYPAPSYVELYNHTDKLLNLRDWRLQRRSLVSEPERVITKQDLFFHPGEYLVLTSDQIALEETMQAENVFEMADFPRFNRASTDKIRLFANDDTRIDSLQYTPSGWGGKEIALERKSPHVPGWLEVNWGESQAPQGGTPGYANSVNPPRIPPEVIRIDYTSPDTLVIEFDRMLDPESASEDDNYILTAPEPSGFTATAEVHQRVSPDAEPATGNRIPAKATQKTSGIIHLVPSEPLQHNRSYLLLISGVQDIFGNPAPETRTGFRFYEIASVKSGDVVINEILYRPDNHGNRRFVELLNRSNNVFDLRGWQIGRSLGRPMYLYDKDNPDPRFLVPGEKVIISDPGLLIPYAVDHHIKIDNFPSLSRFGDHVYILDDDGQIVDSLSYSPDWGGNRDGRSLERIDPQGAGHDPANWREHPESHSAGLQNVHFNDLPDPVEIIFAGPGDDGHITLKFNRFVQTKSLDEIYLGNHRLSLVNGKDTPRAAGVYTVQSEEEIRRTYKKIHIPFVKDFAGRKYTGLSLPLSFLPESGDLILNEIMYQPLSERYSNKPDQSEYVEIYNRSALPLQLRGLRLHDRPDSNDDVQELKPMALDDATLPPGTYAVFFPDSSITLEESRIYKAFPIPQNARNNFYRIDRLTLGLSVQGDQVYLSDRNRRILDSVWYSPSWHNPNLIDTRGISLERIHSEVATSDPANWTSSTTPEGGTPGYANSVNAKPVDDREQGLHLEPNPFSPNGDGHNDHLVIHYALDNPDFRLHVRVFDRQGRKVRTLADGVRAGLSGNLIWDGRNDRGHMGRTGLYIIHFMATNQAGGKRQVFREVAVLAKPLE